MGRGSNTRNASGPVAFGPGRSGDGEQSGEDLSSQSRLRPVGSRVSWVLLGRQHAHNEACRRRVEGLLKSDSAVSARLAAADERVNRASADAVERHVTKDPGMRGILKRTSVVCHPESESQKKIALDTEQDSTPKPSVSYGGSPVSGAQPNITTSTDLNTDVTREVRAGPAQDVTRTSSEDHIGGDVAMRRDGADENSG